MAQPLLRVHSHAFLLLLEALFFLFFTATDQVLGASLRIEDERQPSLSVPTIPHKKLVKRPHGQGWRGPDGQFVASRRTRSCLPAFGELPLEDCLGIINIHFPVADDVKRNWYHKPMDRSGDKPNVQMPLEGTVGRCTIKITPLYPISTVTDDSTVQEWDTATWKQIRNIATALAHGCPGTEPHWGGFQQAGDHGALLISFYDKGSADIYRRKKAEKAMMRALSDPDLTMDELTRLLDGWKVSSMGSQFCSPVAGSDSTGRKKCTGDDSPTECSDAYAVDAANCCLGYTYDEKPLVASLSNLLLGFKSIATGTLSAAESGVGWCSPVQIDNL